MNGNRIRILLVDDHPMMLKGLAATLMPEPDMEVVGSASSGPQAICLYRDLRPDITIMDISMTPAMTGTNATREICREFPDARVIMLSVHQGDEDIYRALQAGAVSYLLKETLGDDLVRTIREVHGGHRPIAPAVAGKLFEHLTEPQLTPREVDVLRLIADGLRNKEIADRLGITEYTAQGHVKSILAKLKVNDRAGAVAVGIKRGYLHIG